MEYHQRWQVSPHLEDRMSNDRILAAAHTLGINLSLSDPNAR